MVFSRDELETPRGSGIQDAASNGKQCGRLPQKVIRRDVARLADALK
jgi:hypothetical protein